jgi:hypothetical protein
MIPLDSATADIIWQTSFQLRILKSMGSGIIIASLESSNSANWQLMGVES